MPRVAAIILSELSLLSGILCNGVIVSFATARYQRMLYSKWPSMEFEFDLTLTNWRCQRRRLTARVRETWYRKNRHHFFLYGLSRKL